MQNQDLIVVKQLPIIQEQLKTLSTEIDIKVTSAKYLSCTEENKQMVKKIRADFNKEFKELEARRKQVKEQVLAPYMQFEEIYKEYIADKYKEADKELGNKINVIEIEQKKTLEDEARRYFEEYKTSKNVDFIEFKRINLKIGVSDNPTKLKKQIAAFIDKIVDDLNLIDTQEHKEEILVEYKQNLNISNAITTVANRFKAIEEEKKKREEAEIKKRELKESLIQQMSDEADKSIGITQEDKKMVKEFIDRAVERDSKPLEQPIEEKQEEILTLRFIVKGNRTQLKALKQFLIDGGYDYE